ncbi:MAG: NADH-quinone oxidoreductase subunit M [Chloroflexi bacterium]|nr:NADH-quinone oxidoreductase subunit M [Chloroflexota bacterium]
METFDRYLLLLLVAVPFFAALATAFIPAKRTSEVHWFVRIVAGITLGLSVYAFVAYDYQDKAHQYQFVRQFPWLESVGVTFHLGIDGITAPLVLLTGIVLFTGILVSWNIRTRTKDFFALLLLLVTGVYGVFTSIDAFFLFFFYELAVLPMYLLIGVWGSSTDFRTFTRTKEYGAMKLTLYLVAGSVLVWVAILALWVEGGKLLGYLSFDLLDLEQADFSRNFQMVFFPLLMVGFGVLAGLWPFHTWSPDGHVAAPTAVSMLHAGVLMKLGAYGILRLGMSLLPEGAASWAPVLITLGTINVLYGATSAMAQRDLKYVVGYSSVSHMGIVLMGMATLDSLGINGAVLQMFSHGIMTALFFALVGFVYDRAHLRDITLLEGLAKRMGVTAVFFAVAGLASLGLPGLSGFVAEFLVFVGVFRTYPALAILGVIGAAITAVYILRLLAKVFFGPLGESWQRLADTTRLEAGATALLVFFLVLWGLYPWPIMKIIDSGVAPLLQRLVGG